MDLHQKAILNMPTKRATVENLESTTRKRAQIEKLELQIKEQDNSNTAKPDWMNIPFYLLTDIRYMLTDIQDYIRFGAVCRLWRSSCVQIPNQRPLCAATPQFPLLNLLSDEKRGDNLETCSLYNISERRDMSKFKLQLPLNNICSSEGWLVFVPDGNQSCVTLFNPFYPSNNKIELPPLVITSPLSGKELRLQKAVLSANPATSSDFVVMIIYFYGIERDVSFLKSGDKDWTHLEFHGFVIEDAIYYKEQFYILDSHEDVHAFDANLQQAHVHIEVDPPESVWGMRKYLVVCSGDLLLVRNWHDGRKDNTTEFEVLKLDAHGHKWVPVNSLGDQALFIGNNSSVAVSSSNFRRCKPNSIYFIGEHDVGVFHVQEGKIELDDEVETRKICAMPVWIEPTLQN